MATKKTKKADVEIGETIKKKLNVTINDKVCEKKRNRIVEALTEKIQQQEKAKPFRDRAKALTEEVEKLRSEIKSSTEERDVPCVMEFHYKSREIQFRRADTKQIVKELTRTMTDIEATGDLFADPKKAQREKAPKGGIVAGKSGAALRLSNPVLTPGEAVAAARADAKAKGSRKAANPAFQEVLDASDAKSIAEQEEAEEAARADA